MVPMTTKEPPLIPLAELSPAACARMLRMRHPAEDDGSVCRTRDRAEARARARMRRRTRLAVRLDAADRQREDAERRRLWM